VTTTLATTPPAVATTPAVVARGLVVRYPRCAEPALGPIDFAAAPGERIALIGPSGGGKTTLLRALEGSVPAAAGTIERAGRAVLIYQDLRLIGESTVLANVCGGALGGVRGLALGGFPEPIRQRAVELLAEVGLAGHESVRLSTLSGGQRQRVAIARALCARPAVLLADEPLASLDPVNAHRMLDVLRRLQEKYRFALVMSLHSPLGGADWFDRHLLVECGAVTMETGHAEDAWNRLLEARGASSPGGPPCGSACDCERREEATPPPTPAQDRRLDGRPAWVGWAEAAAVLAVLAGALGWSAASLNMRGATLAGAWGSLMQFLGRVLPADLAAARELPWGLLAGSLVETIQMAVLGTAMGIVASLPLAVLASREMSPGWLRVPARFLLNVIRTVPAIFWALIFVAAIGLGPLPGILALAAYSVGYLAKMFYEAIEDTDQRPAAALRAMGATRLQAFAHAVFPGARPSLLAACLFVFEYNIRSASILGIVGAGGIGQHLMYYIEWRNFPAATAGLLLILVVVVALDAVSQWWRGRLARARGN
jgi:phosphonate transport system permease protein